MSTSTQTLSVIVPANPFVHPSMAGSKHCLAALDVAKLMEWWPGKTHAPHRNPEKVNAIQRSLDWKRVVQIAAYLLQSEITDAADRVQSVFSEFYTGKGRSLSRDWPPRLPRVVGYQRSSFPTFSNVLVHVNGAKITRLGEPSKAGETATLSFDESSSNLNFSVIDGQHRINGAFLAVAIKRESEKNAKWEIPAEIFLDLDKPNEPPRKQAQIFIDVNFYQKKVDRSLVSDLFPTTRENRDALDAKERAQDLGRKLMLEVGPLVGMVQIPGIKYGVKDVVTLATLVGSLEDILPYLERQNITSLEGQAETVAACLESWLNATGRREDIAPGEDLQPENVVYQGRILVSVIDLVPMCIAKLNGKWFSGEAMIDYLSTWFKSLLKRAGLLDGDQFIDKAKFRKRGFLGSGGIARFRDLLWAAAIGTSKLPSTPEAIAELADKHRSSVFRGAEK